MLNRRQKNTLCTPSFYLLALLLSILATSCSVNRRIEKKVNRIFKSSPVLNDHAVGFALSALDQDKFIVQKNADKGFIPASNTKLFTFYAGLMMLPDSIPALRYIERGDSLIFWGTGDPSFLQRRLKGVNALNFLKASNKKLFFATGRYTGRFYGAGWAWDDYNDYYQAEINELPIMDNLVEVLNQNGKIAVSPAHFNSCFKVENEGGKKPFNVIRDFNENIFRYDSQTALPAGYEQLIPYKITTATTLNLLTDTLHRPVEMIDMEMPASAKTVYNVPSVDVLREMMLPSDNFIAEQLLLVYCDLLQRNLNTADAIQYIREKYLANLSANLSWVDGSGLSRMNLFSPADIVSLLKMIDKKVGNRERLFSMLPAGGKTGTLKNAYPKTEHPFVFGKTGSLSNNYNQSGYLVTKKGRVLAFSFMNNNYVSSTAELKKEMAKLVIAVHDEF